MTTSRRRSLLLGLAALVGASVVALALAEVGVRLFFPHSRDHVVPPGLFEIDSDVGWKLRAGSGGTHETRYFDVAYQANGLGLRDVTRTVQRPPGTRRILVYGDSEIFGWGLPLEERFTNLVEHQLPNTEVWNLAVPGYGIGQQLIAYETTGGTFEADDVLIFASPATLYRSRFDYIYRKPKPRFSTGPNGELRVDPADPDASGTSDRLYRLLSPFYLPYFVDGRLQRMRHRLYGMRQPTDPPFDEAIEQILLRARDAARSRSADLHLMSHFANLETRRDVERFGALHDIHVLTIEMDDGDERLVFGPHDLHWNAEANRIVAAEVLARLDEPPADAD